MPLFEYQCNDCEKSFEELVLSLSNPKPVVCPTCGSPKVRKKLSTFSSKAAGTNAYAASSASSSCSTGGT
ncbi:MAG: zinc ribbon domain-containing protein [Chloroflexi bacterium]|nr:MAG: zinc ribbon domain-containing protein [Chloroflexota bacterium]